MVNIHKILHHKVTRSVAAKNILHADESELFKLANLAGVYTEPKSVQVRKEWPVYDLSWGTYVM